MKVLNYLFDLLAPFREVPQGTSTRHQPSVRKKNERFSRASIFRKLKKKPKRNCWCSLEDKGNSISSANKHERDCILTSKMIAVDLARLHTLSRVPICSVHSSNVYILFVQMEISQSLFLVPSPIFHCPVFFFHLSCHLIFVICYFLRKQGLIMHK